ncbi:MAG: ribonuclease HI [Deltaproteobacteria bacterium]|nr:ribonuclease HI [Deltaproteobacteria bacterium]
MPWIPMRFRQDTTVFARCDVKGSPIARGGRVDIRYNRGDPRLYRASVANLNAIPDAVPFDDPTVDAGATDTTSGSGKAAPRTTASKTAPKPTRLPSIPGKTEALAPVLAKGHESHPPKIAKDGGLVIAYADGACTGNPGPSGLGVLLLDGDHRHELSESLGHGTNNIAELTAILRVLEVVPRERRVEIRTDSQYAIGILSKGWKPKANTELVAEIKDELRGREARFVYVPGHAGVAGNERADALARASIDRGGGTGWVTR